MTSTPTKPVERVSLTRKQVDTVLRRQMGWDPVDVRTFWHLARKMGQGGQP